MKFWPEWAHCKTFLSNIWIYTVQQQKCRTKEIQYKPTRKF